MKHQFARKYRQPSNIDLHSENSERVNAVLMCGRALNYERLWKSACESLTHTQAHAQADALKDAHAMGKVCTPVAEQLKADM